MSILTKAYRVYRNDGLISLGRRTKHQLSHKIRWYMFDLPLIDNYCYQKSRKHLQKLMSHENYPHDALETSYSYHGWGNYSSIQPMHARPNAEALLEYANELEPSVIVEIGAGSGGSLYLWARGVPSADLIISVSIDYHTNTRLFEDFATDADLYTVHANSQLQETLETVNEYLDGREIDLLYIDGDHSYEGVMTDFEMYSPLVAPRGVVMMDDIDNTTSAPEVQDAWEDLSEGKQTKTLKRSEKSSAQGVIQF